jgi:hypothetical protein
VVSSFSVVRQDSSPWFTYVQPTAVCGSNFVRTYEAVGEGYVKDLLGSMGCKKVSWISLSFICNIRKPPLRAVFTSYKSFSVFRLVLFILHVYCMCGVEHICFWWRFCLNFVPWDRNDTIHFLRTQECSTWRCRQNLLYCFILGIDMEEDSGTVLKNGRVFSSACKVLFRKTRAT